MEILRLLFGQADGAFARTVGVGVGGSAGGSGSGHDVWGGLGRSGGRNAVMDAAMSAVTKNTVSGLDADFSNAIRQLGKRVVIEEDGCVATLGDGERVGLSVRLFRVGFVLRWYADALCLFLSPVHHSTQPSRARVRVTLKRIHEHKHTKKRAARPLTIQPT